MPAAGLADPCWPPGPPRVGDDGLASLEIMHPILWRCLVMEFSGQRPIVSSRPRGPQDIGMLDSAITSPSGVDVARLAVHVVARLAQPLLEIRLRGRLDRKSTRLNSS